jgi:hypothetical protein
VDWSGHHVDISARFVWCRRILHVDEVAMMFKRAIEEWRMSSIRHKVGIVVLAVVAVSVMLFAPTEQKAPQRTDPHPDVVPLLAKDSCAIFELSKEPPGCVRNDPATLKRRR